MSSQTTMEPVVRTVTVNRPVAEAFALFTGRVGAWWPDPRRGVGPDTPGQPVLEPRVGGRIYERDDDGTIVYWGELLVWEPPHRLVIAWRPAHNGPATEVEIRFTADGNLTRVDLEHRGWERLDSGVSQRDRYAAYWDEVLRLYTAGGHDNGHAVAAFVLGATSILVPLLGLLAAPFGIIFGIKGRRRARNGARHGGVATAGLTLAVIGLVLWGLVALGGITVVSQSGCSVDGVGIACGADEQVPPGVDVPVGPDQTVPDQPRANDEPAIEQR